MTMSEIRLVVIDPSGLHARPAARFVQAASRFASRIVLRQDGPCADEQVVQGLRGQTLGQDVEHELE